MGNSWQEVESMLRLMLGKIYIQHKYIACYLHNIITNPRSNYADEHEATEFLKKYNCIYEEDGRRATKEELVDSLEFLTKLLHKISGQPVYILIDEYDNLLITY
ncbi:MAG: AAA family ATPase [Candidatus Midichloria sp.]|nr:AAA family ATPase [Candidatus Midichloria sp.]